MPKKPTVILADDHKIFRQGIKSLIMHKGIGDIIAEASNGSELLELLKNLTPDLIIMDISMPEIDGIDAAKIILKENPTQKILALSMYSEEDYYYKIIEVGFKGYIIKDAGIDELENAIKTVLSGNNYFSNELLQKIINNFGVEKNEKKKVEKQKNSLSDREIEVLKLICQGKNNNEIATKLFISPQTVKGHRRSLLSKTACNNTASLVIYAVKNNLIQV